VILDEAELATVQEILTDTYANTTLRNVLVVDGYSIRLTVEHGHLSLHDGVGKHSRTRTLTRSQRTVKRIVILGAAGTVSLAAVQWCHDVGVTLTWMNSDGTILAQSFGDSVEESRLRRAQALAVSNGVGLSVAQRLIEAKVRGHARLLTTRLDAHDTASVVLGYLDDVASTETVERLREVEARAASAFFEVWGSTVSATFATRDAGRIPAQWTRPNSRNSTLWRTGRSARKATDPVNAMLNYAYALAEIECRVAAVAVGLDPALGVLHSDVKRRDSLALDLLEVVRPAVEEHVLDVLSVRRFRAADFAETSDGVCRLRPSVTHPLTTSMKAWARTIGPVAEEVAHTLAASSELAVRVRTPLTRSRQRLAQARPAAARAARREGLDVAGPLVVELVDGEPVPLVGVPAVEVPPVTLGADRPMPTCLHCGRALTVRSQKRCRDCERVDVVGRGADRAARGLAGRQAIESRTGIDPTQTDTARARRAASNARERALCDAFDREHEGVVFDRDAYAREIMPGLARLTLSQITRALGVSDSAASRMRRGLLTPHPRHWRNLAELVNNR